MVGGSTHRRPYRRLSTIRNNATATGYRWVSIPGSVTHRRLPQRRGCGCHNQEQGHKRRLSRDRRMPQRRVTGGGRWTDPQKTVQTLRVVTINDGSQAVVTIRNNATATAAGGCRHVPRRRQSDLSGSRRLPRSMTGYRRLSTRSSPPVVSPCLGWIDPPKTFFMYLSSNSFQRL